MRVLSEWTDDIPDWDATAPPVPWTMEEADERQAAPDGPAPLDPNDTPPPAPERESTSESERPGDVDWDEIDEDGALPEGDSDDEVDDGDAAGLR